jgi:hypothetical protein
MISSARSQSYVPRTARASKGVCHGAFLVQIYFTRHDRIIAQSSKPHIAPAAHQTVGCEW